MLNTENARAFNSSLKKAVSEATGLKVKVEIINSYKFPHCWVRVWGNGSTFSNEFRLQVFDACGFDRSSTDVSDLHYGNITGNYISAHVPEWQKVFTKD